MTPASGNAAHPSYDGRDTWIEQHGEGGEPSMSPAYRNRSPIGAQTDERAVHSGNTGRGRSQ